MLQKIAFHVKLALVRRPRRMSPWWSVCFIDGIIFLPCFELLYQQMSAKTYTCTEGLVSLFLCRKAEQSQLLKPDINQHLYQGGISDPWKDIRVTLALSQPILWRMSALKSRKTHWLPACVWAQLGSSGWCLRLGYKVVAIAANLSLSWISSSCTCQPTKRPPIM